MAIQLLYLWIERCKYDCFNQIDFNFSPKYTFTYQMEKSKLSLEENNKINIFEKKNISNITAVIGENGSGKTALLKYILQLSDLPLESSTNKQRYIAVYLEKDKVKVINHIENTVYYASDKILPYSQKEYGEEDYVNKMSRLYFYGGEYSNKLNFREGGIINYFTFTNSTLKYFANTFYSNLFLLKEQFQLENTKFNALQNIFVNLLDNDAFQSILDINYYNVINCNQKRFLGKKIDNVIFGVLGIKKFIIDAESRYLNYNFKYSKEEKLEKFLMKYEEVIKDIVYENNPYNTIVLNLLGELVFCYDLNIEGKCNCIDDVLNNCRIYITDSINNSIEKNYYENAIKEICKLKKLYRGKTDEIKSGYSKVSVKKYWGFLKQCIEEQQSFVLKYLSINNLTMSSGERTLLNLMSRIYFVSQFKTYFPKYDYKLKKDVLLLVDEIELYQHPEWQRQLLYSLIQELNENFPDNRFQVVLTSHSPIVLSDIPKQNALFLKNISRKTIIEKRKIQTFGTNIHNLYKDAFFIEGGVAVGEYAKHYINDLVKEVKSGNISDELSEKIKLIGEPIIRKRIEQMYNSMDKNDKKVSMLPLQRKQVIDFLKEQRREIEKQISLLEESSND